MRNRFLSPLCLLAFASPLPAANLFVNTAADSFDSGGTCSLREAVQATNNNADGRGCVGQGAYGADTIVLGSGTFVLTRVGNDDSNVLGDLDVLDDLTIDGVAAGATNIAGDTTAANGDRDRVLHVAAGSIAVTLRDLTIRDGRTAGTTAGAGLRTEQATTTTLDHVVVGLNSSAGSAGGILNRGTMTLVDSAVTNNTVRAAPADGGGGGIFNSGRITLTRVRVLNNTVEGTESGEMGGGGLRDTASATTRIVDSAFEDNTVSASIGALAVGGGFWVSGSFSATDLTVRGNILNPALSGGAFGGGFATDHNAVLDRTLVEANTISSGTSTFGTGGGWWARCESACNVQATRLVVQSNLVDTSSSKGGGIEFFVHSDATIQLSGALITDNEVTEAGIDLDGEGGGVFVSMFGGGSTLEILNSTISGNRASGSGGGLGMFTNGSIEISLTNTTVTGNTANADSFGGGSGGGIAATTGGQVRADNSVIAGNVADGSSAKDCDGPLNSARFALIQNMAGCTVTTTVGLQSAVSPQLGALADHGGPLAGSSVGSVPPRRVLVHLPASSSPLLDSGDPAGCLNASGNAINIDQRGEPRPVDGPDPDTVARCDVGAVEFSAAVFADGFE